MDKVVNCLFAAITLLLSVRAEVLRGKEYVRGWLLWLCVWVPGFWLNACMRLTNSFQLALFSLCLRVHLLRVVIKARMIYM